MFIIRWSFWQLFGAQLETFGGISSQHQSNWALRRREQFCHSSASARSLRNGVKLGSTNVCNITKIYGTIKLFFTVAQWTAEITIRALSSAVKNENFFNFPMEINLILHAEWMLIRLLGPLMFHVSHSSDVKLGSDIFHTRKGFRIVRQNVTW